MNKLHQLTAALLALPVFAAYADPCADLQSQISTAKSAGQYAEALTLHTKADGEYCYDHATQSQQARTAILRAWGDALFQRVFNGEPVTFDDAQSVRLIAARDDIKQANEQAGAHIGEAWQLAFLDAMLALSEQRANLLEADMYRRFDQILGGYLDDVNYQRLSPIVSQVQVDEFIKQLIEAQMLTVDGDKRAMLGMRGSGESSLTRLLKERGANLSSSAKQPVTAVTPIRFAFDSTRLSQQGVEEYRENLPIMQANSTNSIFLIGHTDPKGNADYNCWLSQCRVRALQNQLIQDGIPAGQIEIAWAGENIPLDFDRAGNFLRQRDILIEAVPQHGGGISGGGNPDNGIADPMRRRVEYEINGTTLKDKYSGQFCRLTPAYSQKPCP